VLAFLLVVVSENLLGYRLEFWLEFVLEFWLGFLLEVLMVCVLDVLLARESEMRLVFLLVSLLVVWLVNVSATL
jgi:hypothetical protein